MIDPYFLYSKEELKQLSKIKRKRYKSLTEYEKFLLKENVKYHRKQKTLNKYEMLYDPQVVNESGLVLAKDERKVTKVNS